MGKKIDSMVNKIVSTAHTTAQGKCALHVRIGLDAGGFNVVRQSHAYMYASNGELKRLGFECVGKGTTYGELNKISFLKGDILVYDKSVKRKSGHIQIYSGTGWVSDFVQRNINIYSEGLLPWTVWRYKE